MYHLEKIFYKKWIFGDKFKLKTELLLVTDDCVTKYYDVLTHVFCVATLITIKSLRKCVKHLNKMKSKQCFINKMKKVMHEFKNKKLKMHSGKIVKKRKQAVAIGMSEARKKCK